LQVDGQLERKWNHLVQYHVNPFSLVVAEAHHRSSDFGIFETRVLLNNQQTDFRFEE
jgi:hypothetical protein